MPRWGDTSRVGRAAVRHDMEEILRKRINNAYRYYCEGLSARISRRALADRLVRVTKLLALLTLTEKLSTS